MIRAVRREDAAAVAEVYRPYVEQTAISFESGAPAAAEMARRIEATVTHYPWLVAEDGGTVVGYAYAGPHRARPAYRWSVDVSVYLAPQAHRRGIGTRLYQALFDHLRAQGYCNAFAGVALPNPASVGLHESLGFAPVGVYRNVGYKSGRWHDVGWWQLELLPPDPDPPEPRPTP
ncbi:arsinothricin resistance N-acetyltransferase ArsN1 family B [Spongisporangium articulatum]|uniref:Arsinothricin resistance N-acetyltransferase ArsN1 family B n=1 Tax=Spongisporangium articulatum TaxID=3362603 RepID=A0ABW8ALF4_9ACTN